jgi:serine/threonine protein kinase
VSPTTVRDATPPAISGYRFIRHIGSGGNAQVYLYQQELPHREVAVKVLNESALSEGARGRFTAEANVTASLSHRHIVQVFDAGVTDDGRPYLVMPYYPKPNLSVRARRAHFTVAEVLRIGIQIGSAVETSHRGGVLHRDIKPQNILTDSYGEPALTDFGIATTKGGDGPEGLSVPWSPPEILYGTDPGDERADVYSLGATLWHLLAGRSPFEQPGGDNKALALMARIKSDPVPGTGRADVPDSLERLLRQTMAKDPAARPQKAMELIRALQSVEQELRLPVTQPILPSGDLPAEAPESDTGAFPFVRSGDTTLSRGRDPVRGALPGRPGRSDGAPPETGIPGRQSAWAPGGGSAVDDRGGQFAGDPGRQPNPRTHAPGAGQPPWGQTAWSSWGGGLPDTAIAYGPQAPAPGAPPDGADDPTRARGPRRIEPWKPAPGRQGQDELARDPARPEPRGWVVDGGPGSRARQFPPPAPEAATLARPRSVAPGGAAASGTTAAGSGGRPGSGGPPGTYFGAAEAASPASAADPGRREGGRGRVLALAGGGAALAVATGIAVLALSHGGGQPGSAPTGTAQATPAGDGQNALDSGLPDAPIFNRPVHLSATRVEFSWTEDSSVPGDDFRWSADKSGSRSWTYTTKREFIVTVPSGRAMCYVVQATGDGDGSDESAPACSS